MHIHYIRKKYLKVTKYRQIDLDTKEKTQVKEVYELLIRLNIEVVMCIETRGTSAACFTRGMSPKM